MTPPEIILDRFFFCRRWVQQVDPDGILWQGKRISADYAGRELTLQPGQEFLQKPSSPVQILALVRQSLDA